MSQSTPTLPPLRSFLWQFFMQPIRLHESLVQAGIQKPNDFLLSLWFSPNEMRSVHRAYVRRIWGMQVALGSIALCLLIIYLRYTEIVWIPEGKTFWTANPIRGIGAGCLLAASVLLLPARTWVSWVFLITAVIAYQYWNVSLVVGSVFVGTILGLFGRAAAATIWPIAMLHGACTFFIALLLRLDISKLDWTRMWWILSVVVAWWLSFVPQGIEEGKQVVKTIIDGNETDKNSRMSPKQFLLFIFCTCLLGMAAEPQIRASLLVFVIIPEILLMRMYIWLIESIIQIIHKRNQINTGKITLRLSPVYFDHLSFMTPWGFGKHVKMTATDYPDLAKEALLAAYQSPGIDISGVCKELEERELIKCALEGRFDTVANLQGFWMNFDQECLSKYLNQAAWRTLREAAGSLLAAQGISVPSNRIRLLERASEALAAIGTQDSHLAEVVKVWQQEIAKMRAEAADLAQRTLENPFFAGPPLEPDRGAELFRGRDNVIRQLEELLSAGQQSFSLALIGPRRCGKTSLLKMLSQRLPDTVTVFFDLQANPIDTPHGFFAALARQTRDQALQTHHIELPLLMDNDRPFEAAAQWLDALESRADRRKILIAIDEFECLDRVFPGDRRELEKLLGLLRATIQHRRKVRLLVSGASAFDELDRLWSHYFINLREITLDLFDRDTTQDLLSRPRPDFPGSVIPSDVADEVFARTGGQPFLVQAFGGELITLLNRESRRQAEIRDVAKAEHLLLSSAAYYFRDTFGSAPAEAQAALRALAHSQVPQVAAPVQKWLRRRCLVTTDGQLRIPVIGEWIRQEAE